MRLQLLRLGHLPHLLLEHQQWHLLLLLALSSSAALRAGLTGWNGAGQDGRGVDRSLFIASGELAGEAERLVRRWGDLDGPSTGSPGGFATRSKPVTNS